MKTAPLWFIRNGEVVHFDHVPPDRTLLDLLREDLSLKGTKEGCAQGDCGACAVVVSRMQGNELSFHAINSCIRFAHSVQGQAIFTVEGLRQADGSLHPCQQAMVDQHGSQCGFCTPGFIMSLFAMYERHVPKGTSITRETAMHELSGNLCRCTGYRPIFDAAQTMSDYPPALLDREALKAQLKDAEKKFAGLGLDRVPEIQTAMFYFQPRSVQGLLAALANHPEALIVAGGTDVGLWVTKQHLKSEKIIDVSQVQEFLQMSETQDAIEIGAALPLSQAFAFLDAKFPGNTDFFDRYGGLLVRESATLGGNLANGSPIGDSMPLLIALGGELVLESGKGLRRLPVDSFYTGYRQSRLEKGEVIRSVSIPLHTHSFFRALKLSKRQDDDISIVCLAIGVSLENNHVKAVRIGVGGMAATPARAVRTEAVLKGKPWSQATINEACGILEAEFSPISDMRGSADYRRKAIAGLLQRFWLESQEQTEVA
jgi:xanthine dehydrogenase small subunit